MAIITRKVGFLLVLLTSAALLALGVFYWFLNETAAEGAGVGAAAWQRMLAQQMDRASQRILAGWNRERELLATLAGEFERNLEIQERGGRLLDRDLPPADGQAREAVRRLRDLWTEVKPALALLGTRPPDDPATRAALSRVETRLPELPRAAHRVLLALEDHGRILRQRMLVTLAGVAAFNVVVLVVGLWLTERYLTRPVRLLEAGVRRVERGELDEPVPIVTRDELATVTAAFNEMTSALARLREPGRPG